MPLVCRIVLNNSIDGSTCQDDKPTQIQPEQQDDYLFDNSLWGGKIFYEGKTGDKGI